MSELVHHLSSCHSAIGFPGAAMTSLQCRNSSPADWPHRVTWPSARERACLCSLVMSTLTATPDILLGSTEQLRTSLKIGAQLCGFLRVLSFASTLSPLCVTVNLAWGSVCVCVCVYGCVCVCVCVQAINYWILYTKFNSTKWIRKVTPQPMGPTTT